MEVVCDFTFWFQCENSEIIQKLFDYFYIQLRIKNAIKRELDFFIDNNPSDFSNIYKNKEEFKFSFWCMSRNTNSIVWFENFVKKYSNKFKLDKVKFYAQCESIDCLNGFNATYKKFKYTYNHNIKKPIKKISEYFLNDKYVYDIDYNEMFDIDNLKVLLLATKDTNSYFHKDYFPLDLFKIIYKDISNELKKWKRHSTEMHPTWK